MTENCYDQFRLLVSFMFLLLIIYLLFISLYFTSLVHCLFIYSHCLSFEFFSLRLVFICVYSLFQVQVSFLLFMLLCLPALSLLHSLTSDQLFAHHFSTTCPVYSSLCLLPAVSVVVCCNPALPQKFFCFFFTYLFKLSLWQHR